MAGVKWLIVSVLLVGALGAVAVGFIESGPVAPARPRSALPISLRPLSVVASADSPKAPEVPPAAAVEAKAAPKPEAAAPKPEAAPPVPAAAAKVDKPKPADPVLTKAPPAAPAAPPPEGQLNFRASDTADVFLDGKKLGGTPLLGVKAKAGTHKARFDCYDAAGNTVPGAVLTVTVTADTEEDVEFECPTASP